MTNIYHPAFEKIVNPELARVALHTDQIFGEFGVIVRLEQPHKHPVHMKVTGQLSPRHFQGRVPCSKIKSFIDDRNVLSVELREHVIQ